MVYGNYNEAAEYTLDLITKFIIEQDELGLDVSYYRRYIDPDTGQIVIGENLESPIILYEKDFKEDNINPHLYDIINQIVTQCLPINEGGEYELIEDMTQYFVYNTNGGTNPYDQTATDLAYISFSQSSEVIDQTEGNLPCGELSVSNLIIIDGVLNSLSQYITFIQQQTDIDSQLANQVLDNSIYELLPSSITRQDEINKFFADYQKLKGPKPGEQNTPAWNDDWNQDGAPDHWGNPTDDDTYTQFHDVTYYSDLYSGFIPRLTEDVDDIGPNQNQTLQFLRDDLNDFLRDIDSELAPTPADERPYYQNKSDGYIQIRNLNQAIIVRSQEGVDVGLIGSDYDNPLYLSDGFTITMWVKFLDRVSTGTLFNYGNPLRSNNLNPRGFMLETIAIHKDELGDETFADGSLAEDNGFFGTNEYERFIRLVVREDDGTIRDSNIGQSFNNRVDTETILLDASTFDIMNTFNYTRVPIDFNEWYFIVASYNPNVVENGYSDDVLNIPEYWTGNYTGTEYLDYTGTGARCKVEIISRGDLIRARGFQE